ncbi:MAG: phosphoribosylglycinamide formyltransferase [Firmicutes bacterium]|nr:phosphoribosylglycinamide formyltransferase [Bacillota bacterium]
MPKQKKRRTVKKRLVALISGGGSNLQAVMDACGLGNLDSKVVAVISSNYEAGGLLRAKAAKIDTFVCALGDFASREERDAKILRIAKKCKADYLLLLGYLGICSKILIDAYPKKIINIHPALLPKYGGAGYFGLNVHKAVLDAGDKVSGATVHYVDEGTDTGEIIMSREVAVLDGDTAESLQERVLGMEHELIVEALRVVFGE